jgi:hypothetical protein
MAFPGVEAAVDASAKGVSPIYYQSEGRVTGGVGHTWHVIACVESTYFWYPE